MRGEEKKGGSGSLGLLLMANALPLAAVGAFLYYRSRGEVALKDLPPGSKGRLALVGGGLVVVLVLAKIVFPAARRGFYRVRASRSRSQEAARAGGALGLVHSGLAFAKGLVAFALFGNLVLLAGVVVALGIGAVLAVLDLARSH